MTIFLGDGQGWQACLDHSLSQIIDFQIFNKFSRACSWVSFQSHEDPNWRLKPPWVLR